jgi:hypothetical protein
MSMSFAVGGFFPKFILYSYPVQPPAASAAVLLPVRRLTKLAKGKIDAPTPVGVANQRLAPLQAGSRPTIAKEPTSWLII